MAFPTLNPGEAQALPPSRACSSCENHNIRDHDGNSCAIALTCQGKEALVECFGSGRQGEVPSTYQLTAQPLVN